MLENRHNLIEEGEVIDDLINPSSDYITWFKPRTVIHISNPRCIVRGFQGSGSSAEYLIDVISRSYHKSLYHMFLCAAEDAPRFAEIRDLARESIRVVQESNRLNIQPVQIPAENSLINTDYRVIQRQRRNVDGRQGGRRCERRYPNENLLRDEEVQSPHLEEHGNIEGCSHPGGFQIVTSHPCTPPPNLAFISPTSPIHDGDNGDDDHVDGEIQCDNVNLDIVSSPRDVTVRLRRSTSPIKPTRCGTHGKACRSQVILINRLLFRLY